MRNCRLYLILDTQVKTYVQLFDIAQQAIGVGVNIVQVRDKHGLTRKTLAFIDQLKRLTRHKALLIVNDRLDLALASRADGVHLGQDDLPLAAARKIAGPHMIIGQSCQTWAHAMNAQQEGADYIGFGSVFETLTKPDRVPMDFNVLKKVARKVKVPLFAIGGIAVDRIAPLKSLGVERFAVCRAICLANDVPKATRAFQKEISSP